MHKKFGQTYIVISFALLIFSSMAKSQTKEMMDKYLSQQNQSTSTTKINADAPDLFGKITDANVHTKTVPVEEAIKPDKYIVGPNDLFNLGIYGYINQQVPLYVNLEGAVIIPTVGEVQISGLTLSQAKSKVITAVKKRYYSSDVSFSLSMPRTFMIKVSGMTQGNYEVSPVTRASEILAMLYFDEKNVSKINYQRVNGREFLNTTTSIRNIQLIRKDGSINTVDLYKYYIYGNDKYNPYFLEGDLLKMPFNTLDKYFITVNGAVQLPGLYEYNQEDDLETVVGLGRGFDVNAEPDSIVVYRSDADFKKFETINLSYEKDKSFKINNFDRVFVKYKTENQKNSTVLVLGEVNRQGYYPVTFKNTRIKDVIEMSGGFKNTAYLPLCILFRNYDKEYTLKDTAEILLNLRTSDLIVKEMDRLNFESDIRTRRNRVIVDFEKLFLKNDESQNIILEDKDVIYINDDKKTVYVYGQVASEGYVPLKGGEGYEYYIEKAGGYSLAADKGNTRVIKFNSRGWYKPEDTKIMSGDFVYVPKKVNEPLANTIQIISQIAGVLLGVLTTYLLFVK